MDKIGVKIGLNRLPRAVVILCEISRQACKSCEWDPCEALTQIQREDYLWKFVLICGRKIFTKNIRVICGICGF